ncbi:MAG: NAD(P)/FAD-dependent oxidoreductase [Spirochaetaceae bacterium]|nr:NAD(P)/FAD-dependent oxidoreductase [Myxococcales bacterium]MCB9725089.1 NAD(P)/FAD-dependent oxidoreductase [Spirochaetaceae bacterium]
MTERASTAAARTPRVGIIGAGPGGLCMAIRLLEAGLDDLVVFERGEGVGGTWYHNRYPGCECDVASHLYSFSFEPYPDWSKPFGTQPEIRAYMEHCAAKYGVTPYLRLGCGVRRADWDAVASCWRVETEAGERFELDFLVGAVGMFGEPVWPQIPGREDFAGTAFHSARWNEGHDLAGERVAVIGSAASAVQLVPVIAREVAHLDVYQRTANWVGPKQDEPYDATRLEGFRRDPGAIRAVRDEIYAGVNALVSYDPAALAVAERAARAAIEVVRDPATRRALTPTHPFGCKRPLISNDWYPTFNRSNVELVTEPIEAITPTGTRLASGEERTYDTLIFATGFETTRFLSAVDVRGPGGRSLSEAWREGAIAYKGVLTAGFPNLFMLYGPNTNNGSILYMIERQVDYALRQIRRVWETGRRTVEVRPEAMFAYNETLQARIAGVDVWQADCHGYYRAPSGRIVTQYPGDMDDYRRLMTESDDDALHLA